MHCKDTILRTQNNWPYSKLIPNSGNKDTIEDAKTYLIGAPKVWPRMKKLSLNLNFLNGKLPDWILYHPYLSFWDPFTMIFQQELSTTSSKAKNTKGEVITKFTSGHFKLNIVL